MAVPGVLTLGTNIGMMGSNFTTPISGISAGGAVRVIRGNARTGTAGLLIDNLPYGVMNITLREVNADGFRDTDFVIYGVSVLDERSTILAALAKGQTDAQQRAAIAAGSSTFGGLQNTGLGFFPNAGVTPTPTPTPAPAFTTQPSITGTPTVGQPLSSLTYNDGVVSNGSVTSRVYLLAGVAKALSYILVSADVGAALTFQPTATDINGNQPVTATSAPVTVVAAPVTSSVFGNGTWDDTASWNDNDTWKDVA